MKRSILFFLSLFLLAGCGESVPDYMVKIEGGTFKIGNNGGRKEERPAHRVTVNDFYISKFEVYQALYDSIMNKNPSHFKGSKLPVETVTWFDAIEFCNALSQAEGLSPAYAINSQRIIWDKTSLGYRLPTEAEWEFAAKGGKNDITSTFSGSNDINDIAWHIKNSSLKTHNVGEKSANELGLYDMSGNVLEWIWDWYSDYPEKYVNNPKGPFEGDKKVLRGGAWNVNHSKHRINFRTSEETGFKKNSIGFRIVKNVK